LAASYLGNIYKGDREAEVNSPWTPWKLECRTVHSEYSKSKFSQNTTNVLSIINVATCFDS